MKTEQVTQTKKPNTVAPSSAKRKNGAGKELFSEQKLTLREKQRRKAVAHRKAVREPNFVTLRKDREERAPFPLGLVVVLVMITAMFLFMMMNYAEIDRYNGEVREMQKEVNALQTEQKRLGVKLENKNNENREMIDRIATEQLGMVKSDSASLRTEIITLSPEDKTERMEYDYDRSGVGYLLSGFAEVFRGFFSRSAS